MNIPGASRIPRWGPRALAALAIPTALSAPTLWADGLAFKGLDLGSLRLASETEQFAVIELREGREKLLIAVVLELEAKEHAVWILPVPGRPQEVKPDVLAEFPRFRARELGKRTREALRWFFEVVRLNQLWTVALEVGFRFRASDLQGLAVHSRIQKHGLIVETVTSETPEAIAAYLDSKGARTPTPLAAAIEPYIGKDFTFVVAWANPDSEENVARDGYPPLRRLGLLVDFPAERPFYPLLATRAYGETEIPIRVYALGRWRLAPESRGLPGAEVGVVHTDSTELRSALSAPEWDGALTRIVLTGQAKRLNADLILEPSVAIRIRAAEALVAFVEKPPAFWGAVIGLQIVLCYLAGGLAGLCVGRRWKAPALFALWNLTTIIGFAIALLLAHGMPGGGASPASRGQTSIKYVLYTSVFYVGMAFLLQGLATILLAP